jgi:hypothetical protein
MTIEIHPLKGDIAVKINSIPNSFYHNRNESYFPFYYDAVNDLYIGYCVRSINIPGQCDNFFTEDYIRNCQQLYLLNAPVESLIGVWDFRVTEFYFKRPPSVELLTNFSFSSTISVETNIPHYFLPDGIKQIFKRGIDGLVSTFPDNVSTILINDPAKYVVGAYWRDYITNIINDFSI